MATNQGPSPRQALEQPEQLRVYQHLLTRMPSEFQTKYGITMTKVQREALRQTKAALRNALPVLPTQGRFKVTKALIETLPNGWEVALRSLEEHGFCWEQSQWEKLLQAIADLQASPSSSSKNSSFSRQKRPRPTMGIEGSNRSGRPKGPAGALPSSVVTGLQHVPTKDIEAHCVRFVSERVPGLVHKALQVLLHEIEQDELEEWVTETEEDSSSPAATTGTAEAVVGDDIGSGSPQDSQRFAAFSAPSMPQDPSENIHATKRRRKP